ncbi:MAG: PD-(D/E)XK nuclease family protein [Desulfamplus sp.]|nr:PD-(D/E)XK nuclease family protein [Desulfamplus sp.]
MEQNIDQALSNLLIDEDFHALGNLLNKTTIFNIMGIKDSEEPFTRLLAWLLNPVAPHGMGEHSLKSFIRLCLNLNTDEIPCIGVLDTEAINYQMVSVTPEVVINSDDNRGRVDVLVYYESTSTDNEALINIPVLLIEAKIKAKQHDKQTYKYMEWIRQQPKLNNKLPIMVYLEPEVDLTEDVAENFIRMDFETLIPWLKSLLTTSLTDQARFLIEEIILLNQLSQRVIYSEIQEIVDNLKNRHETSIILLKNRGLNDLPAELSRYSLVFDCLGIITRRSMSKGYSGKIEACRKVAQEILDQLHWNISGNEGSLTIRHKKLQATLEKLVGRKNSLNLDFWIDRNSSNMTIAFYSNRVQLEQVGIRKEDDKTLRLNLADRLRKVLIQHPFVSPYISKKENNFTVVKLPLPSLINDEPPENDEEMNIIRETMMIIDELEQVICKWCDQGLK